MASSSLQASIDALYVKELEMKVLSVMMITESTTSEASVSLIASNACGETIDAQFREHMKEMADIVEVEVCGGLAKILYDSPDAGASRPDGSSNDDSTSNSSSSSSGGSDVRRQVWTSVSQFLKAQNILHKKLGDVVNRELKSFRADSDFVSASAVDKKLNKSSAANKTDFKEEIHTRLTTIQSKAVSWHSAVDQYYNCFDTTAKILCKIFCALHDVTNKNKVDSNEIRNSCNRVLRRIDASSIVKGLNEKCFQCATKFDEMMREQHSAAEADSIAADSSQENAKEKRTSLSRMFSRSFFKRQSYSHSENRNRRETA